MTAFSVGRLPRVEFGVGAIRKLPELAASYGKRVLLVTGARSFDNSSYGPALLQALRAKGCSTEVVKVQGEPSPDLVDDAVRAHHQDNISVVIGLGGGSAIDAAKAIAGLLITGQSVLDHLEGVGPELPYRGPAVPFIAVPTTAGTGAEATKNAVLSRQGFDGFKKSFRDDALVAQLALIDPDLMAGCSPALIAANGMDALTQLIESYVSTKSSPFSAALARSGLEAARGGLLAWHQGGVAATAAREQMAYAALLSGICLAQTGLGSVHGLASPLGAFFPIPHGVVCGTLLAAATEVNIAAMEQRAPHSSGLARYAEIGRLLTGAHGRDDAEDRAALLRLLQRWTEQLAMPSLSALGVSAADIGRIVAGSRGSSMKTNPIALGDDEIAAILTARL